MIYSLNTTGLVGSISGTPPNVEFEPNDGSIGITSFTYTATDQNGAVSDPATVSIDVVFNMPPVADEIAISTVEEVPVNITLTGSDEENQPLTFTVETQPSNGSLSGTEPNLTYTPKERFNGTDSFTYAAFDGLKKSATATVTITIDEIVTDDDISDRLLQTRDDILTELGTTKDMLTGEIVILGGTIDSASEAIADVSGQISELQAGIQITNASITAAIEDARDLIIDENSASVIDAKSMIMDNIDSTDVGLTELILKASQSIQDASLSLSGQIGGIEFPEISFDDVLTEINANKLLLDGLSGLPLGVSGLSQQVTDTKLMLSGDLNENQTLIEGLDVSLEAAKLEIIGENSDALIDAKAMIMNNIDNTDVGLTELILEASASIENASQSLADQIADIQTPDIDFSEVVAKIDANEALIDGIVIPDHAGLIQEASDSLGSGVSDAESSILSKIAALEFPETDLTGVLTEIDSNEALIQGILIPDNAGLIQDASDSLGSGVSDIESSILSKIDALEFPETDLSGVLAEIDVNEALIEGIVIPNNAGLIAANATLILDTSDILNYKVDQLENSNSLIGGTVIELDMKLESLIEKLAVLNDVDIRDIELHLLENNALVSLFLPADHGGLLEFVRDLTLLRIQQASGAGINVKNAQKEFDKGVQEIGNGNYAKAFDWFAKAYKQLTNG